MARRTKEEALATRDRILDTAELLFQQRGVSRTSLHDLATAAGVTRGAIYWHFQDKADVFNAMMSRVCLPLEESCGACEVALAEDPLATIRAGLVDMFRRTVDDATPGKRTPSACRHRLRAVVDDRGDHGVARVPGSDVGRAAVPGP